MTFTVPTYQETLRDLIATFLSMGTPITDLREGGILHGILAAEAVNSTRQGEELAQQVLQGQATAAYAAFGFGTLPAKAAVGALTLIANPAMTHNLTVPTGSLFGVPGTNTQFVSTQRLTFPAGASTLVVPVRCGTPGAIGNVGAGTITHIYSSLPGVTGCTNPAAFSTGTELQRDIDRRQSFRDYIAALPRGTATAIEVAATGAVVLDPYGVPTERATKSRYISGGAYGTLALYGDRAAASTALVAAAQAIVDGSQSGGLFVPGYTAAGVKVTAVAATETRLPVHVLVRLAPGTSLAVVSSLIVGGVTALFDRLNIGDPVALSALRTTVGSVAGLASFQIDLPRFDYTPIATEVAALVPFQPLGAAPDLSQSYVQVY